MATATYFEIERREGAGWVPVERRATLRDAGIRCDELAATDGQQRAHRVVTTAYVAASPTFDLENETALAWTPDRSRLSQDEPHAIVEAPKCDGSYLAKTVEPMRLSAADLEDLLSFMERGFRARRDPLGLAEVAAYRARRKGR